MNQQFTAERRKREFAEHQTGTYQVENENLRTENEKLRAESKQLQELNKKIQKIRAKAKEGKKENFPYFRQIVRKRASKVIGTLEAPGIWVKIKDGKIFSIDKPDRSGKHLSPETEADWFKFNFVYQVERLLDRDY